MGLFEFYMGLSAVSLIDRFLALTLYPIAVFSFSLMVFSIFCMDLFFSENKKRWVRQHFGLLFAFCGFLFCIVLPIFVFK